MAHLLSYIGIDNDTYVTIEDGNTTANIQSVSYGGDIDPAKIDTNRSLAETATLKVYDVADHKYMVYSWNEQGEIVDTNNGEPIMAASMPRNIAGWQTPDGTLLANPPARQALNSNLLSHYPQGTTNLDVYGVWEVPHLIRVIVFVPGNSDTYNLRAKYKVALTSAGSYSSLNFYSLSDNYKSINDAPNYNLKRFNDGSMEIYEFGIGDGCPTYTGNNLTSSYNYFGVRNMPSASVNMELTTSQDEVGYIASFIPYYEVDEREYTFEYKCATADYLCRKVKDVMYDSTVYAHHILTYSSPEQNVLNFSLSNLSVSTDMTIFVPLVRKPFLIVQVSPFNSGHVNNAPSGALMPGTTYTLTAVANSGHTFSKWIINGTQEITTNPLPQQTILHNTVIIASFGAIIRTLDASWYLTSGSISNGFVNLCVDNPNYPGNGEEPLLTIEPVAGFDANQGYGSRFEVEDGGVRYLTAIRDTLGDGYRFDKWFEYTGSAPNPSTDNELSQYSAYSNTYQSVLQLTMNNDRKVYAYYVPKWTYQWTVGTPVACSAYSQHPNNEGRYQYLAVTLSGNTTSYDICQGFTYGHTYESWSIERLRSATVAEYETRLNGFVGMVYSNHTNLQSDCPDIAQTSTFVNPMLCPVN